ncbi:MAG: PLP-dependent aminotransferase family protein, partial [Anaerolineales bacterium]|nr:PLP-dependent aminotransferase family protein [Anaerolineales bacterium]
FLLLTSYFSLLTSYHDLPTTQQIKMNITINPHSTTPLYRQIYQQIREQILTGQLHPGRRLPSSRQLAEECQIARQTVTTALDQLQSEGFVTTRTGAGTFVNDRLPESPPPIAAVKPSLSSWGQRLIEQQLSAIPEASRRAQQSNTAEIDFGFGRTFATIFPYDIWRRLLARYLSTDDALLSRYGSAAGFTPLREAVADYISKMRGVVCSSEQIVIVNGIQQALDILSRLLLNEGDELLIETPGYTNAFRMFQAYGARLQPILVDDDGFNPAQIPADSQARLVFVTPSNQFPYGGSMTLNRRLQLLQWAQTHQALIIEDDYDGELRYEGYPLTSLQSLDKDGRVIYLGTFSKVLFPALRLGYVVLPPALQEPFLQAKQLMDRGAPTLTQAAVADFMSEGHFERHLRRLRQEYGERQAAMVKALETHLGDLVTYSRDPAGLQIMLYLPPNCAENEVIKQTAALGVAVYAGAPYHLQTPAPPSLLLGFTGLSIDEISVGIERLAAVIQQLITQSNR